MILMILRNKYCDFLQAIDTNIRASRAQVPGPLDCCEEFTAEPCEEAAASGQRRAEERELCCKPNHGAAHAPGFCGTAASLDSSKIL